MKKQQYSPWLIWLEKLFDWTYEQNRSIKVIVILSLLTSIVLVCLLVYTTGGSKYVYVHSMYIPVLFAGSFFGVGGGILMAVIGGIALGPLMPVNTITGEEQSMLNWVYRMGFFVLVGIFSGMASTLAKRYIAQLKWISLHDAFTHLPNRRALFKTISEEDLGNDPTTVTNLAIISLENSTELKSTFGPDIIDEAIVQLVSHIHDTNISHNIYHAESTIIALLIRCNQHQGEELQKILFDTSRQAITYKGVPLHVDTRMGTVQMSEKSRPPEEYLKQAEVALATARQKGKDSAVYQPDLKDVAEKNLAMLGELEEAIAKDQLSLHYQPKVDIATGMVHGAEALLRWEHPQRGNIPPGSFIPRAEESTLIHSVTEIVLRRAMETVSAMHRQKIVLPIAVNVSTRNLAQPNFTDTVARLLDQYHVSGPELEIEVTESALMMDAEHAIAELNKLSKMNILITIDDFGTGYSSLQYLHRLPVSILKVDQSFIRRLHHDRQAISIVEAAVSMAHSLGMKVVAEGVDTPEVYEVLRNIGCDMAQGFLIASPLPEAAFTAWYRQCEGKYRPQQAPGRAEPESGNRPALARPGPGPVYRGEFESCTPARR
jgi:EAL domain-containing protein (putative c-di-GMP-specific phosphodiesterase class I)/GGDEF domain-containing protein